MKYKVSVIVPVYNVKEYVSSCIDSILKQTLKDIEIIIVNDGSTDNSEKIILKYVKKYSFIKYIKKKNGGPGSARNVGIENASGECLFFIDGDDSIKEDTLEKMYNKIVKDKSDIVICDMILHYNDKDIYQNCTKYNNVFEVTPSPCNKLFKKELFNNMRFISKIWYEDLDLITKLLFNTNKISCISEGLYIYNRTHESITINNNSLKNLDIIYVLEDIKEYLINNNKYDDNIVSYLIYEHILLNSISRVLNQKCKDKKYVLNKLIKYVRSNINGYKNKEFYKNLTFNKKLIGFLNYNYLYYISNIIFKVKKIIFKSK